MIERLPSKLYRPLSTRDKVAIALLGFFLLVAFTLELYWLLLHRQLVELAPTHFIANLFAIYGVADRAYFDAVTPFSLCLEGINVYFTQIFNVVLIYAIVKRKPYRHALQLTIGSYLTYSVVLYFLHMQVGGFAEMKNTSFGTLALFYGANMPWLAGHAYLAYESFVAITRHYREASPAA